MSKYEAACFVGDNQAINRVPSRFYQSEESRRIFGLACSPIFHRKDVYHIIDNYQIDHIHW